MKLKEIVDAIAERQPNRYIFVGGSASTGGWAVQMRASELQRSWEEVNEEVSLRTCGNMQKVEARMKQAERLAAERREILKDPIASRDAEVKHATEVTIPNYLRSIKHYKQMLEDKSTPQASRIYYRTRKDNYERWAEEKREYIEEMSDINNYIRANREFLKRYENQARNDRERIETRNGWTPLEESEVKEYYDSTCEPYALMVIIKHKLPMTNPWYMGDKQHRFGTVRDDRRAKQ